MHIQKIHRHGLRAALFLVLGISVPVLSVAAGAAFPERPIRVVVAFSPGSAPDIVARTLGEQMSKTLKVPVLVENKLGADGVIASDSVAKAAPDGHTLYLATMGNLALASATIKTLPYDAATAFRGVGFVANNPFAILVKHDLPVRSVADLIQASHGKSQGLNYGSAGTVGPLVGAEIKRRTGANMTYILYKGAQPALVDLVGGQLDMVIADLPSLLPLHQQGKARLLVVTTEKRSALAPDIPTMGESGFKGFDVSTWYAMVAPNGTPDGVIGKLNEALNGALKSAEVSKHLSGLGMTASGSTPKELDDLIRLERERWERMVRETQQITARP